MSRGAKYFCLGGGGGGANHRVELFSIRIDEVDAPTALLFLQQQQQVRDLHNHELAEHGVLLLLSHTRAADDQLGSRAAAIDALDGLGLESSHSPKSAGAKVSISPTAAGVVTGRRCMGRHEHDMGVGSSVICSGACMDVFQIFLVVLVILNEEPRCEDEWVQCAAPRSDAFIDFVDRLIV